MVVAIDARRVPGEQEKVGSVYARGAESAGLDAVEWAVEATGRGADELLVAGMDTDGHLKVTTTPCFARSARPCRCP